MPQLHCYVPDAVAEKLQHKAEQSHLSVSKYLAELVKKDLGTDWPDDFFNLFGAWEGEPLVRENQGEFEERLELN